MIYINLHEHTKHNVYCSQRGNKLYSKKCSYIRAKYSVSAIVTTTPARRGWTITTPTIVPSIGMRWIVRMPVATPWRRAVSIHVRRWGRGAIGRIRGSTIAIPIRRSSAQKRNVNESNYHLKR